MTHFEQTASPGTELGRHTPGPWEWWTSCSWKRLTSKDANGRWMRQGNVLCPAIASDGHPVLDVSDDDMALIAAAPTMLEAFYTFPDHVDFRDAEAFGNAALDWWGLTACPAIALAEGRTEEVDHGVR